ncbi:MAG: class I SAM-dependent methyltransferase [Lachnospiraceae bacterium]|nr:class I SAM-dependent methyltransferase [Lachnospiraceae bacterium]
MFGKLKKKLMTVIENTSRKVYYDELKADVQKTIDSSVEGDRQNIAKLSHDLREYERKEVYRSYKGINYQDFENAFRGSRDNIKKLQSEYLKYYEGRSNVVDIGCGRGEFLELLKENGIEATGVDMSDQLIAYCRKLGLNVVKDDALNYIKTHDELGGIFASQVIEHLQTEELIEFLKLTYEKLADGAYLIVETPNPRCLSTFTNAFYMDFSHDKPVHPLTVRYILQRAGFKNIEIVYTEGSRMPYQLPEFKGEGIENLDEINEGVRKLNDLLYGSQDYAVIAQKIKA